MNVMEGQITYSIPFIPESLNKFAGRTNVWAYRAEKQRWKDLCTLHCWPRPKAPLEETVVRLTFHFRDRRRRDLDNLIKPVTDGLVAAGIIADDCYQCIDIELHGAYDKARPRTEISIRDRERRE